MSARVRPNPTIEQLHAALLASASATAVLEALFGAPVVIRRLVCDAPPLSPLQHAHLRPTLAELARHRRVMLLAGGRAVSEADLWYVPARLMPGMEAQLHDSDTPFGTVVRPLRPPRQTLAARICADGEPFVLEHEAVLVTGAGVPFALVSERYLAVR